MLAVLRFQRTTSTDEISTVPMLVDMTVRPCSSPRSDDVIDAGRVRPTAEATTRPKSALVGRTNAATSLDMLFSVLRFGLDGRGSSVPPEPWGVIIPGGQEIPQRGDCRWFDCRLDRHHCRGDKSFLPPTTIEQLHTRASYAHYGFL